MNLQPNDTPARFVLAVIACAALVLASATQAETPTQVLSGYVAASGTPAQPARGQKLFTSPQGNDWRCASCHGAVPTRHGKLDHTVKVIAPLAPAFNAERFTDPAKVEKWFRRNCNDVLGRECSATEKADVLAWLVTLQP